MFVRKRQFARTLLLLLLLQARSFAAGQQTWLAFRYSSTEVLFYLCEGTDTTSEQQTVPLADPVAKWGAGGYSYDD